MRTSASQLQLLKECERKWWFRYKAKLPELKSEKSESSMGFGRVLHACCERYLRGAEGEKIFPEGWDFDKELGRRITPVDASLIRKLIPMAIEKGYLERRPGQSVEEETLLPTGDPTVTHIIVKKDFATKDRVEDHKNAGDPKWLLGPKKLAESIQMNIYAKDLIHQADQRGELLKVVSLCHNQYIRDPEFPEVRRREVDRTRQQIEDFWNTEILPLVKKQGEISKIENPFEIPDPPVTACNKYGPCPRMSICSGQETVDVYRRRMQLIADHKSTTPMSTNNPPPIKPRDLLATLRERGAAAPPAPAAVNPPPPAATPAPAAAAAPAVPAAKRPSPPWANPNCPLCGHTKNNGFMSSGKVCRICEGQTQKSSAGYTFHTEADGTIVWQAPGAAPVTIEQPATVADGGAKKVYGEKDLIDLLKQAKTVEEISPVIEEGRKVLSGASLDLFFKTVEARMEQLAQPPALPPVELPPVEPPPAPTKEEPAVPFEPPKEPPKRPVGRPRKNPAPTPSQAVADAEAKATTAVPITTKGFVLLLGCTYIRQPDAGMKVVTAEDIIEASFPGYWDEENVFQRRDKLRVAVRQPEFLAQLEGTTIIQRSKDDDVRVLMDSLFPFAAIVVQGLIL